ncbi:MAG: GNAT family N-acetyltransferase [Bacteroidota bacterium]|nr:GNAT family N-acetyltransferase [Bacteroidota bacterium]
MQKKITTERLSLDLLTTEDYKFIRELTNTTGWLTFIGDRNIHQDEDAMAYITRINSTPDFTYWIVRLKQSNECLGIITFLKRNYLPHFDIGFAFLPEHCGQGYAYEAAGEVLSIVNRMPEHNAILATTIPENIISIKLLKKLGFYFKTEIEEGGHKLHVYSNDAGIN